MRYGWAAASASISFCMSAASCLARARATGREVAQNPVDGGRVARRLVFELVGGMVGIAQQRRALGPQAHDFRDDRRCCRNPDPSRRRGPARPDRSARASARFFNWASGGWLVVFCNAMTHLPVRPRACAAAAAAPICTAESPSSSATSSTITAPLLVAFNTFCLNSVVNEDSSPLMSRSRALSAVAPAARRRARTRCNNGSAVAAIRGPGCKPARC